MSETEILALPRFRERYKKVLFVVCDAYTEAGVVDYVYVPRLPVTDETVRYVDRSYRVVRLVCYSPTLLIADE
jgi:hypothetical protein